MSEVTQQLSEIREAVESLHAMIAAKVEVLQIKPDDVLVLDLNKASNEVKHIISRDHGAGVGKFMRRLFPKHQVLILNEGVALRLASQGEKE